MIGLKEHPQTRPKQAIQGPLSLLMVLYEPSALAFVYKYYVFQQVFTYVQTIQNDCCD
jgi:hypothetical protein